MGAHLTSYTLLPDDDDYDGDPDDDLDDEAEGGYRLASLHRGGAATAV